MKHTKGPWEARQGNSGSIMLCGDDNRPLGKVYRDTRPEYRETAKRIVSCVNGCDAAGIVDPSALADYISACEAIMGFYGLDRIGSAMTQDGEQSTYNKTIRDYRQALAALRG